MCYWFNIESQASKKKKKPSHTTLVVTLTRKFLQGVDVWVFFLLANSQFFTSYD